MSNFENVCEIYSNNLCCIYNHEILLAHSNIQLEKNIKFSEKYCSISIITVNINIPCYVNILCYIIRYIIWSRKLGRLSLSGRETIYRQRYTYRIDCEFNSNKLFHSRGWGFRYWSLFLTIFTYFLPLLLFLPGESLYG